MLSKLQTTYLFRSLIVWLIVVLVYSIFGWKYPSAGPWVAPLYLIGVFLYGLLFFRFAKE